MLLRDFVIVDAPMWTLKGDVYILFSNEGNSPLLQSAKLQGFEIIDGYRPEWMNDEIFPGGYPSPSCFILS